MLTFRLSDAIIEDGDGKPSRIYREGDWLMIYEWLCRQFVESGRSDFEILNATSSINNGRFDPLDKMDCAVHLIAYFVLNHLPNWFRWETDPLLANLGIHGWKGLYKDFQIKGRRPTLFPKREWFQLRGRRLNYSPNDFHPDARWIDGFAIRFDATDELWEARVCYGYTNDGGWYLMLTQRRREHLDSFARRIDLWLSEILERKG